MENNRVSVKIYGQEYVISGDASREHIITVADYVDTKMHEISSAAPGASVASLAVLSAVNIADEYFSQAEEKENLIKQKEQALKDAEHYVQLWDESKANYMNYKEDASHAIAQKEELARILNEKTNEIELLKRRILETESKATENAQAEIEELRVRCKELENNFFDLQMENIKLKSEIERSKRTL